MKLLFILTMLVVLSSCSSIRFPGVHRISVQQGNLVSQQMIDRLKPGMTKSQVRYILGNPVLDDSLDRDRWDYVHTLQIAGGEIVRRTLAVYFIEERLSYFEGGYLPSENRKTLLPEDA